MEIGGEIIHSDFVLYQGGAETWRHWRKLGIPSTHTMSFGLVDDDDGTRGD